jgi:hypothetical protein
MKIPKNETGNVSLEFIAVVVALLIPLTFIAGAVSSVVKTNLAQEAAARAGARAFVVAPTSQLAYFRARAVIATVLSDSGIQSSQVASTISCSQKPCFMRGGVVTVTIKRNFTVPVLGHWLNRHVLVTGSQSVMVNGANS